MSKELIQKLSNVMDAMGNIPKRGKFKAYGTEYDYLTNDDVAAKLQEALVKEGVLVIPKVIGVEQKEIESKSGTKGTHTHLDMMFEITDGESSINVPWRSEAQDWNDKGIGKAITYGKKYFIINLFQIATGDPRDDSDSSVDKHEEVVKKKPQAHITREDITKEPEKNEPVSDDRVTPEQITAYEELAAVGLKYGVRAAIIDERLALSAYDKIYKSLEEKIEKAKAEKEA